MKLTPQEIKNAIQEHENKIQELQEELKKSSYVTGFERVEANKNYSFARASGTVGHEKDEYTEEDDNFFVVANYGQEKRMSLLEKTNRLQRLMYRFSCENGGDEIDWDNAEQDKYFLHYNHKIKDIVIGCCGFVRQVGQVYFVSREAAEQALEQFRPLMEEIIKEEQEVKEYYLNLNSEQENQYKFTLGRQFVIDNLIYQITDIGEDDVDVFYDIQTITNTEAEVFNFTESELTEIILRGSFNE